MRRLGSLGGAQGSEPAMDEPKCPADRKDLTPSRVLDSPANAGNHTHLREPTHSKNRRVAVAPGVCLDDLCSIQKGPKSDRR